MTSWMKDLCVIDMDDTHILLSRQQFESLNAYEASVPTSPSVGRAYRSGRFVYECVADDKPGYVKHVPREALILE